eukprot:4121133-Pleurochrysis_carterae.AAC.1
MPPSFLCHLTPPIDVSGSIPEVIFLCNLIYSMSPLTFPLPVYDPSVPANHRAPCPPGRSMLPLPFRRRVRVYPFLPLSPRDIFVPL